MEPQVFSFPPYTLAITPTPAAEAAPSRAWRIGWTLDDGGTGMIELSLTPTTPEA